MMSTVDVDYQWRGDFDNAEVNALHAEGFGHRILDDDWKDQLLRHSLVGSVLGRGASWLGTSTYRGMAQLTLSSSTPSSRSKPDAAG